MNRDAYTKRHQYSKFANASYVNYANNDTLAYLKEEFPNDDFKVLERNNNDVVILDESRNEIIISYRGTQQMSDWVEENSLIAFSAKGNSQTKRTRTAVALAHKYKTMYPNYKITLAAHSLGGGISMTVAQELDLEAYVYDPAVSRQHLLETEKGRINIYRPATGGIVSHFAPFMKDYSNTQVNDVDLCKGKNDSLVGIHSMEHNMDDRCTNRHKDFGNWIQSAKAIKNDLNTIAHHFQLPYAIIKGLKEKLESPDKAVREAFMASKYGKYAKGIERADEIMTNLMKKDRLQLDGFFDDLEWFNKSKAKFQSIHTKIKLHAERLGKEFNEYVHSYLKPMKTKYNKLNEKVNAYEARDGYIQYGESSETFEEFVKKYNGGERAGSWERGTKYDGHLHREWKAQGRELTQGELEAIAKEAGISKPFPPVKKPEPIPSHMSLEDRMDLMMKRDEAIQKAVQEEETYAKIISKLTTAGEKFAKASKTVTRVVDSIATPLIAVQGAYDVITADSVHEAITDGIFTLINTTQPELALATFVMDSVASKVGLPPDIMEKMVDKQVVEPATQAAKEVSHFAAEVVHKALGDNDLIKTPLGYRYRHGAATQEQKDHVNELNRRFYHRQERKAKNTLKDLGRGFSKVLGI